MDKEQHFERLLASGAEVACLQKILQHSRDEQARLDTERGKNLEELKAARENRITS